MKKLFFLMVMILSLSGISALASDDVSMAFRFANCKNKSGETLQLWTGIGPGDEVLFVAVDTGIGNVGFIMNITKVDPKTRSFTAKNDDNDAVTLEFKRPDKNSKSAIATLNDPTLKEPDSIKTYKCEVAAAVNLD